MSGGAGVDDPTLVFYLAIRARRDALVAEIAEARAGAGGGLPAAEAAAVIAVKERAVAYLGGFLQ